MNNYNLMDILVILSAQVEYSVECLQNMAVDEVSVEEMIDEGVLEVFMDILKLNPYNEKIQQRVGTSVS